MACITTIDDLEQRTLACNCEKDIVFPTDKERFTGLEETIDTMAHEMIHYYNYLHGLDDVNRRTQDKYTRAYSDELFQYHNYYFARMAIKYGLFSMDKLKEWYKKEYYRLHYLYKRHFTEYTDKTTRFLVHKLGYLKCVKVDYDKVINHMMSGNSTNYKRGYDHETLYF